jgi:hypothetical protein
MQASIIIEHQSVDAHQANAMLAMARMTHEQGTYWGA